MLLESSVQSTIYIVIDIPENTRDSWKLEGFDSLTSGTLGSLSVQYNATEPAESLDRKTEHMDFVIVL